MPRIHIRYIRQLQVRDVQELRELGPVRRRLVQHDDELGVTEHRPRRVRLQEVEDVLCDPRAVGAVLPDPLPELEQELRGILVNEEEVDLIDEDECLLPLLPVPGDPVQDGVEDDEHTDCPELLAEIQDVVADQAVRGIHVSLLREGVEGTPCEELELQRQGMRLRLRLLQEFLAEVLKGRRRPHIVALLVEAVYALRTAVDDGLLPFGEFVSRDDLLAERLEELGLLDDRVRFSVVPRHVHGVDVVRGGRGDLDDRASESFDERCVLPLRIHDDDVRVCREDEVRDFVLRREGLARAGHAEDEGVPVQEPAPVRDHHVFRDDVLAELLPHDREDLLRVAVELLLRIRGVDERQHREHHPLVPRRQILEELPCLLPLLLHIVGDDGGKVVVHVLPPLPVRDVRLHAEEPLLDLPDRLVRRDRHDVDRQHQVPADVGELRHHIVPDI